MIVKIGEYLSEADIIPPNFLLKPRTLVIEAPNGFGKTTNALSVIEKLTVNRRCDYIYFMSFSHKTLQRAVNKLSKIHKIIYHKGVSSYCPLKDYISSLKELGIPVYLGCSFCKLYKDKSQIVFNIVKEQLQDKETRIVAAKKVSTIAQGEVCTYPFIKKLAFDPRIPKKKYINYNKTLIIITPISSFVTPVLIEFWENLRNSRLKPRKAIMVLDELDEIIFRPIFIHLEKLDLTDNDKMYIEELKKYKIRLDKLVKLYKKIYRLTKNGLVYLHLGTRGVHNKIKGLVQKYESEILKAVKSVKDIAYIVYKKMKPTCLFKVIETLYLLYKDPYPEYTLRTFQIEDKNIVFEEYNIPLKLFFDIEFPFKYFWKIGLTATFPNPILEFIEIYSRENMLTLYRVNKIYGVYGNVYVWLYDFRNEEQKGVSHNYTLMLSLPEFPMYIKKLIRYYRLAFHKHPKGFAIWLQNKKQFRALSTYLARHYRIEKAEKVYTLFNIRKRIGNVRLLVSYCGSPIARGVDLPWIDISWSPFVNYPKLRPFARYLSIDYEKTIARTVQAIMRAVRSPMPSRPKAIVIPPDLYYLIEKYRFPDWFIGLPKFELVF